MFDQRCRFSSYVALLCGMAIVMLAMTCTGVAQTSNSNLTVLYNFTGTAMNPQAGGILDSAGNVYGTSDGGGDAGVGTVFKVSSTGVMTVIYSFKGFLKGDGAHPNAGLVMDALGNLYGTTANGGANQCLYAAFDGCGTVFKIDPGGHETVLHSFTSVSIYGANSDGANPSAGLTMDTAGNLYGTTFAGGSNSGGTVFKMDTSGNETVLYAFGASSSDGAEPAGGLLVDSAGNLYGTTQVTSPMSGGWGGTVFKIDPSGHKTTLYTFTGPYSPPAGAIGDGANPTSRLVRDSAGNLYGTTPYGGNFAGQCYHGCGTVFKLDTAGHETVLYRFSDSVFVNAGTDLVVDKAGNLYGTAPFGSGFGYVFKVDPIGNFAVFYTFTGTPFAYAVGWYPTGVLTLDSDGTLYGSTERGGSSDGGTLFKLDSAGHESLIYNFPATNGDGARPNGALILDSGGNLYGTTQEGGIQTGYCPEGEPAGLGCGTVFKLNSNANESLIHTFAYTDGANPTAGLVMDSGGNLYGTTSTGGAGGLIGGTAFKSNAAGQFTTLYDFESNSSGNQNGFGPNAGLMIDGAGNLYGANSGGPTESAAAGDGGVIYKLSPAGNITSLYSFPTPAFPNGTLIMDKSGNLYGTTVMGGVSPCPIQQMPADWGGSGYFDISCGTVFKIDPLGNKTTVYAFTGTNGDGAHPTTGLTMDSAGNLYGTTYEGGSGSGCAAVYSGCGTVFKIDPAGNETILHSFTGTNAFSGANGDGAFPEASLILDTAGNLYGTTTG